MAGLLAAAWVCRRSAAYCLNDHKAEGLAKCISPSECLAIFLRRSRHDACYTSRYVDGCRCYCAVLLARPVSQVPRAREPTILPFVLKILFRTLYA